MSISYIWVRCPHLEKVNYLYKIENANTTRQCNQYLHDFWFREKHVEHVQMEKLHSFFVICANGKTPHAFQYFIIVAQSI